MIIDTNHEVIDLAVELFDKEILRLQIARDELLKIKGGRDKAEQDSRQREEEEIRGKKAAAPAEVADKDGGDKVPISPDSKIDREYSENLTHKNKRPKKAAKSKVKKPAEVRQFISQADIIAVLDRADEPLSEFKIKEALAEMDIRPSDKDLKRVLDAKMWRKGDKRYRLNEDVKYELYDPDDEEDDE